MPNPILVTGAAGRVVAVGRPVTGLLLKQGKAVRAMVRNEGSQMSIQNITPSPQQRQHWLSANVCLIHR